MRETESGQRLWGALAVAILIASTSAILVRLSEAPSVVKVFYRLLLTAVLLAPVTFAWYPGSLRRLSRWDATVALATGAVLAVHYVLWFESLEWTTVAASVTLAQTQTIFVALGAYWLLGEAVSLRTVVGILCGFLGVAAMSMSGLIGGGLLHGADPMYGNGLALTSGVLFAGYLLAGRSLRQRVDVVPYVTLVYGAAAVVVLGIVAARGLTVAPGAYPPRERALFLALALGPTIVSQGIINWALGYVRSSVVSVAFLGVPVSSTLMAFALFAERPGPATVIGGALVLLGIYVTTQSRA